MKNVRFILASGITVLMLMVNSSFLYQHNDPKPDAITGKWFTMENRSIVEIYKAVDNRYYGRIIWLKNPTIDGKPKTDIHNPDDRLKNRPVVGLVIMTGFTYSWPNQWLNGKIYVPHTGGTYPAIISMTDPNQLMIKGYLGISGISKTVVWNRVK